MKQTKQNASLVKGRGTACGGGIVKKSFSILLAICMLLSVTSGIGINAYATESGTLNNGAINWRYNSIEKSLVIAGEGEIPNFTLGYAPWYNFMPKVESITIGSGITRIGNNSFVAGFNGPISVSLPDTLVSIGICAFYNITRLKNIVIPNSVKVIEKEAFDACWLESINLGNGLEEICEGAFSRSKLKEINIPNSVKIIGDSVFNLCNDLTSIQFQGCIEQWNHVSVGSNNDIFTSDKFKVLEHNYQNLVSLEPNCTQKGIVVNVCDYCNGQVNEILPALGHTPVDIEAIEPVCGNEGMTAGTKCSVCGEILSGCEVIPATGVHTYDDGVVTTEPTCAIDGVKTFTCTNCNNTYTEAIPAFGHLYVLTTSIEPNCKTIGTKIYTCTTCDSQYAEIIEAIGHTPVDIEAIEPVCGNEGMTAGTKCSVCGEILSGCEVIPATGVHTYDDGVVTVNPTCTVDGIKTFTCTNCNDTYTEAVPAIGHNYSIIYETTPTCKSIGVCVYRCINCGDQQVEVLSEAGHTAQSIEAVEPTCIATGLTAGEVCSVCGEILSGRDVVPMINHKYMLSAELSAPATCKESGTNYYRCSVCGDSYITSVPALTHNNHLVEHVEPTVKERGYDLFRCENCAEEYKDWLGYADNSALMAALVQATWFKQGDFSAESYEAFKQIKDTAESIANGNPTQSEIDSATYNVLIAVYSLEPYASFGIEAENGSFTVSYDGGSYTDETYSILYGTEVTLTAVPDEGYEFGGWFEQVTKRIFSDDASYTFKATSNMAFKAIFTPVNTATLEFKSCSGQLVDRISKPSAQWSGVTSIEDMLPDIPYRYGYENGRWDYDEAEVLAKLANGEDVTIIPVYEERDFDVPEIPNRPGDTPTAVLRFKYDGSGNVGIFAMRTNIPEDCRVNTVGIAFYSNHKNDFNPCDMFLTLYSEVYVSQFNEIDPDGLYIVDYSKMSMNKNYAAVGYITYFDKHGSLKTAYSNQVNVIGRKQV